MITFIHFSWIALIVAFAFHAYNLQKWRQFKIPYIARLSNNANIVLNRYRTFYAEPYKSRLYPSNFVIPTVASVPLALLSAFYGHWWGFGIMIIFWMAFSYLSELCSPIEEFEKKPRLMTIHNEITEYICRHIHQLDTYERSPFYRIYYAPPSALTDRDLATVKLAEKAVAM